jgi:hypothetical protein
MTIITQNFEEKKTTFEKSQMTSTNMPFYLQGRAVSALTARPCKLWLLMRALVCL